MHEEQSEQLSLFQRKTFPVVEHQVMTLAKPTPVSTIMQTLPAYRTYLASGKYSEYTVTDFSGDVSRLGQYLGAKPLQKITYQDLQQWIAQLQHSLSEKTVSRRVSAMNNYFL